jgi:excisionase family DNA binding protein
MSMTKERPAREPVVYTVAEAAKLLGFSPKFVYDLTKRGELETIRIGKRILIPREGFHAKFGH